MFNKKGFCIACKNSRAFSLSSVGQIQSGKHIYTLIISWSEVTSVWKLMERSNFCMERSNFCMERSNFVNGAK